MSMTYVEDLDLETRSNISLADDGAGRGRREGSSGGRGSRHAPSASVVASLTNLVSGLNYTTAGNVDAAANTVQRLSSSSSYDAMDEATSDHNGLDEEVSIEQRVGELMAGGLTRHEAMQQVSQENMDAHLEQIREDLSNAHTLFHALAGTLNRLEVCGPQLRCFFYGMACLAGLAIWIVLLLGFCGICMNIAGWFVSFQLVGCDTYPHLRNWLLLWQLLGVTEAMFGCILMQRPALVRSLSRYPTAVVIARISHLLAKITWNLYLRSLAAKAWAAQSDKEDKHCGIFLPKFMLWLFTLFPCALLYALLALLFGLFLRWVTSHGLIDVEGGAPKGTLNNLEVIEFNPDFFADPEDPQDDRPQKECCFCLDTFSVQKRIVRTPCGHIMHRSCLDKWLRTSRLCPVCRTDVSIGVSSRDDVEDIAAA